MGVNEFIKIGMHIKDKRIQKGIKQKDMALALDIPKSTYANYENGHREPPEGIIEQIAVILDTTPLDLMHPEFEEIEREAESRNAIVAILEDIYGRIESKAVTGSSGFSGHYYLVGDNPNSFLLYDGDIEALLQSTKASLPALVERMKDTRKEDEAVRDYISELNGMEPPQSDE